VAARGLDVPLTGSPGDLAHNAVWRRPRPAAVGWRTRASPVRIRTG